MYHLYTSDELIYHVPAFIEILRRCSHKTGSLQELWVWEGYHESLGDRFPRAEGPLLLAQESAEIGSLRQDCSLVTADRNPTLSSFSHLLLSPLSLLSILLMSGEKSDIFVQRLNYRLEHQVSKLGIFKGQFSP